MRKGVSLEQSAAIRAQALKENLLISTNVEYFAHEIPILYSDYPHVPAVKELFEMYEEFKKTSRFVKMTMPCKCR